MFHQTIHPQQPKRTDDRILRAQAQLQLHKDHMPPEAFAAIRDALKGR